MLFLKKHYEKVILAALLFIFVLLLGFQILIILRAKDVDIDSVVGVRPPRPDYKKIQPDDPAYELNAVFGEKKSLWAANQNKEGESDVCEAAPLVRCPFGPHLIPVTNYPKQNAKQPGKCSYCGKEIRVLVSSLIITAEDSDGDGMPDKWEQQYGLNFKDPNDAILDPDDDGFTNLEECKANTNPKDPKSRPTYAKKLYVVDVKSVPLGLRLKHFASAERGKDPKKWEIQIEVRRGRRYRPTFTAVGGVVTVDKKSYLIESIQEIWDTNPATKAVENKSRLILRNYDAKKKTILSEERIQGELGKEIVDPRKLVTFYFPVDKVERTGFVGDQFQLGDERRGIDKYTIIEGNEKEKTAQLKSDNGVIESIPTMPQTLLQEPGMEGMPPGAEGPMNPEMMNQRNRPRTNTFRGMPRTRSRNVRNR